MNSCAIKGPLHSARTATRREPSQYQYSRAEVSVFGHVESILLEELRYVPDVLPKAIVPR